MGDLVAGDGAEGAPSGARGWGGAPSNLAFICGRRCMCRTQRNFQEAKKKFSPKKHRSRVGGGVEGEQMSKPCPLHDKGQKKNASRR